MDYKISITGDLGSGKTTVCKLLCTQLSCERYSTGTVVRELADKMGMPIHELNAYIEDHPDIDIKIDSDVEKMKDIAGSLIVDSRMAWHFLGKGWFSVYLSVDIETAAERIMGAHRKTEQYADRKTAVKNLIARRNSENLRYKTLYGKDNTDLSNYNIVINTSGLSPEQVAEHILANYKLWKEGKTFPHELA